MNERSFIVGIMLTITSEGRTPSRSGTPSDKRAAISRAAVKVFAQRGFFNAQVADVARAAGVAAGTVYLYFRSKDEILISIFERTMAGGDLGEPVGTRRRH